MAVFCLQYMLLDIRIQYCLIYSIADRSTYVTALVPVYSRRFGPFEIKYLDRNFEDKKNSQIAKKYFLRQKILRFLLEHNRKENPRPFAKG